MTTIPAKLKPLLRGHFHQAAFFFALGACMMLLINTTSGPSFLTAFVYSLSLVAMFGISALYHRGIWTDRPKAFLRRLDHAAIFVLIAGSATPIFVLAVGGTEGNELVFGIWASAAVGVVQAVFWTRAPKVVSIGLYIFCGWYSAPYIPEIRAKLGAGSVYLLLAGGLVYTVGALIYGFKRPNLVPKVFGYHELFHLLVIIAATLHFIVVVRLVN